jgi:hypothetical protein
MTARDRFTTDQGEQKFIQSVGKNFNRYCAAAVPFDSLPALDGNLARLVKSSKTKFTYIWAYTGDECYHYVNIALREDGDELKQFGRFVWLLREQIRCIATENNAWFVGTVYRGISAQSPDIYDAGKGGKFPSFTSTSTNSSIASNFSGGRGVLLIIDLRDGCGVEIKDYSQFSAENEVLLRPYVNFVVTRKNGNHVFMTVTQP